MSQSQSSPNAPAFKLAMLGMVDGNGHPYSWSAIFNGYDKEEMATCPYPGITQYLAKQPAETFGIGNAKVTHIWTDDPADAERVSRASLVPNVVARPEDVIGEVDAVLIATDIGSEHVERCRLFVEAGVPIFVDKPMVDNRADLEIFRDWIQSGALIMSSSCMRYAKEFAPLRESTHDLGELRFVSITTPKSWERYGIHALEGIYPILGPGFLTARNTGAAGRDIVHFTHKRGVDVIAIAINDMYGGFGHLQVCGTASNRQATMSDSYYAFKTQLEAFVSYLTTGQHPFPFAETDELMRMVAAGIESRNQNGAEIKI